ncbi:T9SS type A sorting domain-containing protein [Aquimarina sp. ERC-38]|nr:T9SS type A sorting domain-containing protein [Aquimarina sp. ERC-38]
MYPNPVKDIVSFSGLQNQNYTVTFNNILGQRLYSQQIKSNSKISIDFLDKGIYIVMLEGASSEVLKSFSLIKE